MGSNSGIEWTQSTWNPWHGCLKVSPGCKNCYMYRDKSRYGQDPRKIIRSKTTFEDPLRWNESRMIFTCSWSDFFIKAADAWRNEAWDIISRTPQHTYQILTKRAERIAQCLPADWGSGYENVWLGVSIENQDYMWRKELLLKVSSHVRFISAEPLLGPIEFESLEGISWVITGGESGPKARPMSLDWVRTVRDKCKASDVAFFHKQNGGKSRIEGAWGGRLLDGKIWDELPYSHSLS
ncbi:MAG: phage Gp37/Gp68 family protein [Flavobacteriales bacterium]|nr:phage Gp37/Gp68 family protein [Flavobacteriales bacterium]